MATGKGTNKSGYFRKDLKIRIFRSDGGATAEKIRTDPKMAGTRRQNSKFGSSSSTGKMVRDAIVDISKLGHSLLSSEITRLCGSIMDLDESTPPLIKPPIIFSRGLHLLNGYNLNKSIVFDNIISTPIQFTIDRQIFKAAVQMPPLNPGLNFRNNWNQPFFRIKINLGIIRDMVFDGVAYKPISPDPQEYTELVVTEWLPTKEKYPAQSYELQIQEPVFDENCYLLLGIGIEFGTMKKGGINGVKDARCGKILGVA